MARRRADQYRRPGEVYFASRADGAYEQRVALKRRYRETAPDLARFLAERRILASLDHPGIARLVDGGVADDGRLYAVVEYVDGQSLVEHCRERRATHDERLGESPHFILDSPPTGSGLGSVSINGDLIDATD